MPLNQKADIRKQSGEITPIFSLCYCFDFVWQICFMFLTNPLGFPALLFLAKIHDLKQLV
jgi:hypothetical protein